MKRLLILILICLLLPINAFAFTYGKVGESTDFNGSVNIPTGEAYLINGAQITSGALSDVASIAMLDENETITGNWTISSVSDDNETSLLFLKKKDGDPTDNVADDDRLGLMLFGGYHTDGYFNAARIVARVDGTPGKNDMPGELEFWTTPDDDNSPDLRMVIDNAGNIKMGDGAWTNYVNVTAAGVLTFEGTATITPKLGGDQDCNNLDLTEVKTVQFNGVYAIGNSGSTETVDWQNGAYQSITIDEACVISFSNEYVGTLNLVVTYGGSFALTFNGADTFLEEGGTEIVTTDAVGTDILIFKNLGVADTYVMGALIDVKD